MIVFGLLLLLLVAAVVVIMVMAGSGHVTIGWDAINLHWEATALMIFVLGAVSLLVLVLAFACLRNGTRRRFAKGRELRRLRKIESNQPARPTAMTQPTSGGVRTDDTATVPSKAVPSKAVPSTAVPSTAVPSKAVTPPRVDAATTSREDTSVYGPRETQRGDEP